MKPHLPLGLLAWMIAAAAAISYSAFSTSSNSSKSGEQSHSREHVTYTPTQQRTESATQHATNPEAALLSYTEEPSALHYSLHATPGLVETGTSTEEPTTGETLPTLSTLSTPQAVASTSSDDDATSGSAFSPAQPFSDGAFAAYSTGISGSSRAADTPVTASYEGNTLTIVSGQNAAVRMKDNTKHTIQTHTAEKATSAFLVQAMADTAEARPSITRRSQPSTFRADLHSTCTITAPPVTTSMAP